MKRTFQSLVATALLLGTFCISPSAKAVDVGISGPVTFFDGEAYWGGYVTLLEPIDTNFSIGGETGFQIKSADSALGTASQWVVPILLTGIYQLPFGSESFHPFIGAGIGAGIINTGASAGGFTVSDTKVAFEALAHVGATFGGARGLFVDVRLGVLDSSFLLAPSIGFNF